MKMKKMSTNERMQAVELLGVGLTVQEVSAILSRTEEEIAALKKKEEQGHGKDRTRDKENGSGPESCGI